MAESDGSRMDTERGESGQAGIADQTSVPVRSRTARALARMSSSVREGLSGINDITGPTVAGQQNQHSAERLAGRAVFWAEHVVDQHES